MQTDYQRYKAFFIIFFVLTVLFYGNSVKNKFCLDDEYVTVTNPQVSGEMSVPNNKLCVQGFRGIPKIWRSRYVQDGENSFEYRPVTSSMFAIEYGIFGQNPAVNHFMNILLYFFTISLLFIVLMKLLENDVYKVEVAFLISMLFLIHPMHTEVIDSIKNRDEILALLFSLLAFWFSLQCYQKPSILNVCLIILCLLLGMFSKKTAILFLAIIPLAIGIFRNLNLKLLLAAAAGICIVYLSSVKIKHLLLKADIVREFYSFENNMFGHHYSFIEKSIIGLKTLGFYIKFSLFPLPFRFYYGSNVFDVSPTINYYFFIAVAFFVAALVYFLKTKNKLFLFGFCVFVGSVFPFVNFVTPVAGVLGERLAYVSSIGFSIIIVSFYKPFITQLKTYELKNILRLPYFYGWILTLICMVYVINRNSYWHDKVTLFEHDMPVLKESAKANSLMANEYFELLKTGNSKYGPIGLINKTLYHYNLAIKNDSAFYSAYNNAGVIYYSYLKDLPKAEFYFKHAIKAKPLYPQAYENLGNCYKLNNDFYLAYTAYKKALQIDPKQYSTYIALIKMFYDNKDYKKAIAVNRVAETFYPNNYNLVGQLADCYFMMGDKRKAIKIYERAYILAPNTKLATYLYLQLLEQGDTAVAKQYQQN